MLLLLLLLLRRRSVWIASLRASVFCLKDVLLFKGRCGTKAGVGTYLFEDACEDSSLRPTTVTEETVYEEMRALADVFKVNVTPLIDDMLLVLNNLNMRINLPKET